MKKEKLCKDCKWCEICNIGKKDFSKCVRGKVKKSLVTGQKVRVIKDRYCDIERQGGLIDYILLGYCCKYGFYFEQKTKGRPKK